MKSSSNRTASNITASLPLFWPWSSDLIFTILCLIQSLKMEESILCIRSFCVGQIFHWSMSDVPTDLVLQFP